MYNMNIEEKIKIISESKSFSEIPVEVLPSSHKENYYFVSYSHKDYKIVLPEILKLEELGINIWYDSDMHIGENWKEIAQLYISKFHCAGIIFYLTENSIKSPACNQEVEYVLNHNKKFISINKPLDGTNVKSGYDMLLELKEKGFECNQNLVDNFKKAFSNEILYLDINDSIENKVYQISSIEQEDLYELEKVVYHDSIDEYTPGIKVNLCKDNTLINVDIAKQYMVNEYTDYISSIGECVFTNCSKLQKVVVSDKLREIGESAFRNCTALKEIDLSKTNAIKIGRKAFVNCDSLKDIDLSKASEIGIEAFRNCKSIDVSILNGRICEQAFYKTNIKNINYVAEECVLESMAFSHCDSLEKFNIKGVFVQDLGGGVFDSCKNLEEVGPFIAPWIINNDNDATLKVNEFVFSGCSKLEEITFKGAWEIGSAMNLFSGCKQLKKIDMDIKSKTLPYKFACDCENLEEVTNSEKFTIIGESAFSECGKLKSFDLTNAITLNESCFSKSGIEKVYLKNVKRIDRYSFFDCQNLKTVYIGGQCEHIGENAFYKCKNIVDLTLLSDDATIERGAFAETYVTNLCLSSKKMFDFFNKLDMINNLNTLYLKNNLDYSNLDLHAFTNVESDKLGFNKFINKNHYEDTETPCEIDIASEEINEPDYNYPFFRHPFLLANALVGKHVLLKHRRIGKPKIYFVQSVEVNDDEKQTIEYMMVSAHTGKYFPLSGTLIESAYVNSEYEGDWFKIDAADELNGKMCAITTDDDVYRGKVLFTKASKDVVVNEQGEQKYNLLYVIIYEFFEQKAISGIDITSIVIFDQGYSVLKEYNKK